MNEAKRQLAIAECRERAIIRAKEQGVDPAEPWAPARSHKPTRTLPYQHSDGRMRKNQEGATAKQCTKCKLEKPLDAFMLHKRGALGRHPQCNECRRKIAKEYTRLNREAKAGRERPNHCECCGQERSTRRELHYDHDHETGLFRGWICHGCNTALGNIGDSIDRLELLIAYLKRGGGPA